MKRLFRLLCALLALLMACSSAALADDLSAQFEAASAALLTPAAEALQTGAMTLRVGDSAYVPAVAPPITAFDAPSIPPQAATGAFESSDPSVVQVDATGLMHALAEGEATVTYHAATGDAPLTVTVSQTAMPERIKALIYVARREFYLNQRARMPKYNQYTKWYYGKKKEVGWCSVFTIWCANASGIEPVQEETLATVPAKGVVLFREGQVGNQYDGFSKLGRFTDVPRPGYLVIYGDLSNGYRTTHIGVVVDAVDQGDGLYRVTTVEGNMSNTVKSYTYLYDANKANSTVGVEKGKKLQKNMSVLPAEQQTDPLVQYKLHTDHWCVFGFGATWQ